MKTLIACLLLVASVSVAQTPDPCNAQLSAASIWDGIAVGLPSYMAFMPVGTIYRDSTTGVCATVTVANQQYNMVGPLLEILRTQYPQTIPVSGIYGYNYVPVPSLFELP